MFGRALLPVARSLITPSISATRNGVRQASHSSHHITTMNELPVPSGSWETYYKAKQTKYNMHLAIGVVFATVTVIVAKASGLVYLNFSPPPMPAEE